MCNPILIGGAAAMAAGQMLNHRAMTGAAKKQQGYAAEEIGRQDQFMDEGEAAAKRSINLLADPSKVAGGADRKAQTASILAGSPAMSMGVPLPSSAPTSVSAGVNQIIGQGKADGRGEVATGTQMRGFNDGLGDVGLGMNRNAQSINFINNKSAGSQRAAQIESASVGPGRSMLGDLLIAGGNLGGLYGATRAPAAGAAPMSKTRMNAQAMRGV